MEHKEFIYNNGKPILPVDGRYSVVMDIQGDRIVLEKTISKCKGSNHLPVFGLRHFKIPLMDFEVVLRNEEVRFVYDNGVLVDTLSRINCANWLGKIFYRGKFIDWFWLKTI